MRTGLGFSDFAQTFKVSAELNRSSLNICDGEHLFSLKTILGSHSFDVLFLPQLSSVCLSMSGFTQA